MTFWLAINSAGQLVPGNEEAAQWLRRRKPGEVFDCKVRRERNYRLLSKAYRLVRLVHENDFRFGWRSLEECREALTIAAGHVEPLVLFDGRKAERAKSWSFSQCSEEEFVVFYKSLVDVVFEHVYPEAGPELQMELEGYL